MKKIGLHLSGKLYEVKKQYPAVKEFGKRMDSVKSELNKNGEKIK
ncbi:MAG: hypothetical protein PUC12_15765 [Clostridiales bacterium]|nr:hypothetical protein [Clostridiales bacterium]